MNLAGKTYTLSFHAGKNGGAGVTVKLLVEALDGSNAFLSKRPTIDSRKTHTFTFTARSSSTILRFSDKTWDSPINYDIDIDEVWVMAN